MRGTWRWAAAVLTLALAFAATVSAQEVRRGSIGGSVKDDTGASLPGVSVSVSGPALQVPQIIRVTDERGEYQVIDLPAGTYRVQYELGGFGTLVREGIVLTTGFAAKMDVVLKVAALAETVTVSGESPVVDVTTTRGGATLSNELIASIPGNQTWRDVLLMVGGAQAANAPLTAQVNTQAQGFNGKSYGAGVGTSMMEGVKMNGGPQIANMTAYEEVDVKTFGNTADVDVSGAAVQLVMKSGGNQFHGRYNEIGQNKRFDSTNIDDKLRALGVTTGDTVVWYNDFSGDLGGRIVRDKLWFYGNVRDGRNSFTVTGHSKSRGPDGVYATADDIPGVLDAQFGGYAAKFSYQATPKNKFISVWSGNRQDNPQYYDRYHPVESTIRLVLPSFERKPVEWQGTLNNRWLLNGYYAYGGYNPHSDFQPEEGTTPWTKGAYSVFDRVTLQQEGPAFNTSTLRRVNPYRHQINSSVNYLPSRNLLGSHSVQAGYRVWFGTQIYQNPSCGECPEQTGIGEYQLIFDTVGGVPHQGLEFDAKNFPVYNVSRQDFHAAYVMDSWRPTNRLTLNLGLRWERQTFWTPEGIKEQGSFGLSGPYPRVDAGNWRSWAPRFGAAYDLSGDGKTVLKGTYGWFNDDLGVSRAETYSYNQIQIIAYTWHDLNKDGKYQAGEVDLNQNGPDFLSINGAPLALNPDLRLPHTHEVSGSVERALGPGVSLRGLYVYKVSVDALSTVNRLRPFSVWNRSFTRQDPGPDGVLGGGDDGPLYTIYDYDPAYRGAAFVSNWQVNADADRHDSFKNIEVMLTKRSNGRWFGNTSILATKSHLWRVSSVTSPNDNIFPVGDYWDLTYLVAGGVTLPYQINVSALNQMYNGLARQRTNQFRRADPAGGPAFPSSATITIPVAEQAELRGPFRNILNLRFGKDIRLHGSSKITVSADAFNALNSNIAWGQSTGTQPGPLGLTEVSGPSYNLPYSILQPRMWRFGVTYEF